MWTPNDRVTGAVVFRVAYSTPIVCMRVKFVGREYISYGVEGSAKEGKVVLFKDIQVIYGSNPSALEREVKKGNGVTTDEANERKGGASPPKVSLQVGSYRVAFSFTFPSRVAPSCLIQNQKSLRGQRYSQIVYQIKAYADVASVRSRDVMSVVPLPVVVPMSALQERFLQNDRLWGVSPLAKVHHNFYCCGVRCCDHGEVTIQATCNPHVAVVQEGTTLHIAINIVNNSSVPIHSVEVSIRNRVVVRPDALTTSTRLVETAVVQSRVAIDVQSRDVGQTTTSMSLPSVLRPPPSMVSHLIRSKWFVVVCLAEGEDDAAENSCWMPIVVVPSIDGANGAAPIDLVEPL